MVGGRTQQWCLAAGRMSLHNRLATMVEQLALQIHLRDYGLGRAEQPDSGGVDQHSSTRESGCRLGG